MGWQFLGIVSEQGMIYFIRETAQLTCDFTFFLLYICFHYIVREQRKRFVIQRLKERFSVTTEILLNDFGKQNNTKPIVTS